MKKNLWLNLQRMPDNKISKDGVVDETTAKKGHYLAAMTKKGR